MRDAADFRPANPGRRNFLVRCAQGAGAALVPAALRGFPFFPADAAGRAAALASDPQFYLHPHYRSKRPLEATLLKVDPTLDVFVTEKYHDQIAPILAEWSARLRQSPVDTLAIEKALSPDFLGSSWQPVESKLVRSGPPVDVHRNKFAEQTTLAGDAFLEQWHETTSPYTNIFTAEFQITGINLIRDSISAEQQH